MPAKSEDQRKVAAIAYAVKTGQRPKSDLRGAAKEMYRTMTIEELYDFASGEQGEE